MSSVLTPKDYPFYMSFSISNLVMGAMIYSKARVGHKDTRLLGVPLFLHKN